MPDPDRTPEAEEVARTPAARLFVERAGDAYPGFGLTRTNAAAVAADLLEVGRAPARAGTGGGEGEVPGLLGLLSRLDQALQAGGARDLPERQRTMRSTLDWSYELLSGAARRTCSRDCPCSPGASRWKPPRRCAPGVASPKRRCWPPREPGGAVSGPGGSRRGRRRLRYRMLEPVRQYALEKLEEGGEEKQGDSTLGTTSRSPRRRNRGSRAAIRSSGSTDWRPRTTTSGPRSAVLWRRKIRKPPPDSAGRCACTG